MTIVLTGGGSGGHITPILAVAEELKKLDPSVRVIYIGQTGDNFADIPGNFEQIDEVYTVRAGKFRRYQGEMWRTFIDPKTVQLNIRDFFRVIGGTFQSIRLLKRIKPSVIFTPGGFVGVPVGLAARFRRISFVTHDLDSSPGLANRINARWAVAHAVALPKNYYSYPEDKIYYVGVPVNNSYQKVTSKIQGEYRAGLKIPTDARVICVTGGGQGAETVNSAIQVIAKNLLHDIPNLTIIHIAGKKNEDDVRSFYNKLKLGSSNRVIVKGFINDLYRYSAAADIIITRAGATALAEFALQQKPCIVIPHPNLSGAHQVKNAQLLLDKGAIEMVSEADLKKNSHFLYEKIKELLTFSQKRERLSQKISQFAKPKAAKEIASLIVKIAGEGSK